MHTPLDTDHSLFGIEGSALQWFSSYLSDRSMKVCVNEARFTPRRLKFTEPQGSVAGPVLYNMYASTLPEVLTDKTVSIVGYADDHGFHNSFSACKPDAESSCVSHLQNTLSDVKDWMNSNRLRIYMND